MVSLLIKGSECGCNREVSIVDVSITVIEKKEHKK